MNKVIEYIIGAKDATAHGISSALSRLKNFAVSVGRNLTNIQSGFAMLSRAASAAYSVIRSAFQFETMTVQFKTLIGNVDEAREHMKMLQKLGETPPFSLEAFATASRSLIVMTDKALGFKDSLELIGDAAAATGTPIENLAHEVGRAYAIIRDGQPITRATMSLRNMGVITPEVAAKLDELQKAGVSNIEVWRELENELKRYKGAMAETEQTGQGMMDAISSQWDTTIRTFGEAFMNTAKEGMGSLLEYMKRINEDGTLEEWAARVSDSLMDAWISLKQFKENFDDIKSGVWETSGLSDLYHGTLSIVAGASAAAGAIYGGASIGDAFGLYYDEASLNEMNKGYYTHQMMKNGTIVSGNDSEMAKKIADESERLEAERERRYEEIRERAKKRKEEQRAAREAKEAEKAEKQEEFVEEQMAEAQAKQDQKREEEEAQAYAEEYAKWWEKQQEEELRAAEELAQKEEAERLRVEQKIQRQRLLYLQQEVAERQSEEAEAAQRLAQAQANSRQAWGWYRNRDSWKAQLEEERANAEAEKQFAKEADSLTRQSHWRTRNLSDDQEVVRRVLLAREEEKNAREYARQTAEATAAAAESLAAMEEFMAGEE